MASVGDIFSGGGFGGVNIMEILTYSMWFAIIVIPLLVVIFALKNTMFFHYLVNVYRKQSTGILFYRDVIHEKIDKRDKNIKYWKMAFSKRKMHLLPPEFIFQAKPSLRHPLLRGSLTLYEDQEGNIYPIRLMEDQLGADGTRYPLIYPEPREWKEAYAQEMHYHAKKLVPKKWYENVVTVGIVTLGLVAIGIALIMKLAPNLK